MDFYKLKIKQINRETANAISIFFEIPQILKDQFQFKPGQYLTLADTIYGTEVRRAYSICTPPHSSELGVTIKLLEGGLFSGHAFTNWQIDTEVSVAPPEGNFIVKPDFDSRRDHVFIAAGSGITPVMSMIQSLLEEEPKSACYLLYGSRNEDEIIFFKELAEMEKKYEGQFFLVHTLSKPSQEKSVGLTGLFKKPVVRWRGEKGRISDEKIQRFLHEQRIEIIKPTYYICGPGDLIESASTYLLSKGVHEKQIKKEYFSVQVSDQQVSGAKSVLKVTLQGEETVIATTGGSYILDEMLNKGKTPPYSCTSGACSTCIAKVTKGRAEMDVCHALDDDEIEAGYILTCQAKPVTPEVDLTYDI
jgi:ring-1,2-phenylacetyl-CoA epoxidase subunit PaaE